jgi:hypothetical protein
MLNKQLWTADRGWSSSLGVALGLQTPNHKKSVHEIFSGVLDMDEFFGMT